MRRYVSSATGTFTLVTAGLMAATALADCPRDLDRLNAAIETLAAQQGETVRQEQLQALRQMQADAQRLHNGNNDMACTDAVRQAMAMINDIAMPQLAVTSDLRNTTVVNDQGQELGKITDLIVDLGSSRVAYAILSAGGFLGIGESQFPVPWEALKTGSDGKIVLPIEKDHLEAAPRFSHDLWPGVATRDWQAALYRYYGLEAPAWARSHAETAAAQPSQPAAGGTPAAVPAQLQQQLADLKRQISDLSGQMNQLTQQVATEGSQQSATASENAKKIQTLSDQLTALRNQVGGIDQQAVNEQIAALQQELDALRQNPPQPGPSQAKSTAPGEAQPPGGGPAAPQQQQPAPPQTPPPAQQ